MSEYGFRISLFTVSSTDSGGGQSIPLDSPVLGADRGAYGVFRDAFKAMKAEGPERDRNDRQHEVVEVHEAPHYLLIILKGGNSGDEFEVTDEDGEYRGSVEKEDALTWQSRLLLLFPAGDAIQGIQVIETRGNANLNKRSVDRLNKHLRDYESLRATFTHDVTDAYSWQKIIDGGNAQLEALEFETDTPDDAEFPEELGIQRLALRLEIDAAPNKEQELLHKFLAFFIPDKKRISVNEVLDGVGGTKYQDSLAEGSAKAIMKVGKTERSIRLNSPTSWFTRAIESEVQLNNHEFLHEIQGDVLEIANEINLLLPEEPLHSSHVPKDVPPETAKGDQE